MNDDQPQAKLRCPSCRSIEHTPIFTSWNGYPIVRCTGCALVYTDDRDAPPPDALYPAFEQSSGAAHRQVRSLLSVFLRQREAFVHAVKGPRASGEPPPRLLDYGCGSGAFARWMAGSGYDVVGLEPFSLGAPTVDANLQLVREPLASAKARLGTFDVITLWHVLEHLHRPVEVLTQLGEMLAPDGVMVVSVPNFKSAQSAIFRGAWFHLDPPRHLLHFEPGTLRDVLRRSGLTAVEEKRFLPEYGSSGWVQSTLNRLLPHKNFLFEAVKDRGALREMPRASAALHLAASLALGAPVLAASLPLEALASARDQGAALTLAAKKRGEAR